ncbi:hypothetical protein [Streptomyces fumanus]|uniref:Membrane protein n=1 Tax=Streptomyces fumanus TaxID=67302 RepID=A0A919AFD0_9ACTN|nr:hypothetical protein [Streptomyces fumanus]GHF03455.1 membrane protein [Streptomyces fumanus]
MGIESDQVVYEYLSRVGDVAQQRQLPSSARMRLVAELRDEIDRRRSRTVVDSPAAVRRIVDRLGSPEEVVEAAGDPAAAPGTAKPPVQRATAAPRRRTPRPDRERDRAARPDGEDGTSPPGNGAPGKTARPERERRKGLFRAAPRPAEQPAPAPAQPHLAPAPDVGAAAPRPDWWRVEPGPFGGGTGGDTVPGFVGGVEIPELLKPPPPREETPAAEKPTEQATAPEPAAARRLPRLWPTGTRSDPLLLLAAALLLVGAVLGNLLPLALGWLLAYFTRRLTPAQSKWAVLVLPGLAVTAGLIWLWGRTDSRWGTPIPEGHMNEALTETWPWVLKAAALASALYLLWRSRRQQG